MTTAGYTRRMPRSPPPPKPDAVDLASRVLDTAAEIARDHPEVVDWDALGELHEWRRRERKRRLVAKERRGGTR